MSKFPTTEMVVLDIAGSTARIQCDDVSKVETLRRLGFEPSPLYWSKSIRTPDARIELVRNLIQADAIFSEGRDWSPAELVQMYAEQGVVPARYRTIRWLNSQTYQIVDVAPI